MTWIVAIVGIALGLVVLIAPALLDHRACKPDKGDSPWQKPYNLN